MHLRNSVKIIIYVLMAVAAFLGVINSPIALVLGFVFTFVFGNPYPSQTGKAIGILLKVSVVGLGFGMLVEETLRTGKAGFGLMTLSIVLTVALGLLLARLLKLDRKLGHLLTSGTAICGGSAIAAIAPVIRAEGKTISIALGIVFLLNAIALLVFPPIGHLLNLSQEQFGMWCAIAIHDTSSVVGATLGYGEEALRVATTVKLTRTLWIVPLALFSMVLFKDNGKKIKVPYFILMFIAAVVLNSYHVFPPQVSEAVVATSKRLLVLTLFLVGTSVSIADLKATGAKPLILAVCLWLFISVCALGYVMY